MLLCNLLQFLDTFEPVTSEVVQLYAPLPPAPEVAVAMPEPALPEAWAEAFEYTMPDCHDLLRACLEAGAPVPVPGYELLDGDHRVVAMAELAWEDLKVAVFLPDQEEDRAVFAQTGWRTFDPDQNDALLEVLK